MGKLWHHVGAFPLNQPFVHSPEPITQDDMDRALFAYQGGWADPEISMMAMVERIVLEYLKGLYPPR